MCWRFTVPCRNSSSTTTAVFGTGPLLCESMAWPRYSLSILSCSRSGKTSSRRPYLRATERSSTASGAPVGHWESRMFSKKTLDLGKTFVRIARSPIIP